MAASWIPCDCCGDFLCTIHGGHAYDCECPPIDEWGDIDPYSEKPMNSTDRVTKHRKEAAKLGRKRKEYLVSDNEHVQIKLLLKDMRA